MCNNDLTKHAEILKNKYKFDIDGVFDPNAFLKSKLLNDKALEKHICNTIYKIVK